jgi:hypothetical protein
MHGTEGRAGRHGFGDGLRDGERLVVMAEGGQNMCLQTHCPLGLQGTKANRLGSQI